MLTPLAGQQSEAAYLLAASTAVDPDRYAEVRGTPYRYEQFLSGTIYDVTLNRYELDSLNFNGHTSQFEYYVDGELRELVGPNFLRAEIQLPQGGEHVYGYGANFQFRDKYAEIIYRGTYVTGSLVYDVANDEKVVQDVGQTVRLQRFNAKQLFYAVVDGDLVALSSSAKRLAEDLGFKKELTAYIKQHNLKPGRYEDLIQILAETDKLYEKS